MSIIMADGKTEENKKAAPDKAGKKRNGDRKSTEDARLSAYSSRIEQGIADFRNEHANEPNKDIVRCVKRVIFGDKKSLEDESLNILIETFRKIVDICGLDPQKYDTIYGTRANKRMFVDNLSRKITALADDACKEECAFQRKRMLFKMVYPEYYESHFDKIQPYDLFFVSGENKASLVRAAKPISDDAEAEYSSDGIIVDRLIMNAINEAFSKVGITDPLKIMDILADDKKIRAIANPIPGQKNTVPGCFSVINERKCYGSYLDFYFLNLSKEDQLFLVDDFMEIRKKAKIEPVPLLDRLYNIFVENRDAFMDNYYG